MSIVPGWPMGVRAISLEDMESLGIDNDGMLHWGGRPMIIQQRLILTPWQMIVASILVVCSVVAAIAGFADALNAGVALGCKGSPVHRCVRHPVSLPPEACDQHSEGRES